MPELPEVQTTVNGLKKKVLGRTFVDVWTDWKKMIKKPPNFELFKKELVGKKIKKIWRRAKNVIFDLSEDYSLLIHQKMTGHLMAAKWQMKNGQWKPEKQGPLQEKINLYIHLLFTLNDGQMIALSDLRKFAKAELWKKKELIEELKKIGPEPLGKKFTFIKFKERIKSKKGAIKTILMDNAVLSGVGNIYANEALWWAKIHPQRKVNSLTEKELKLLYRSVINVLKKGIKLGGESFADYRNVDGEKGMFDKERRVYKREKQFCFRCRSLIKRVKFNGRSSFFCPKCQIL